MNNYKLLPAPFSQNFLLRSIYLGIINYWDSIFTLYLTWGAFKLACVLFLLFLSVFSLTDTNDSHDSWERRGKHYLSCFPLLPSYKYSFSSSRFPPLLFNLSVCNYQTDSWWGLFSLDLYFICIFIDAIKSELLTFIFQSDIVRIWAHIKISLFCYKSNGLTNWH